MKSESWEEEPCERDVEGGIRKREELRADRFANVKEQQDFRVRE